MPKYIFFTGGVVSGLGKGITAAALGRLFKARGFKVDVLKLNPYFNVDSTTLSPCYHGEVYITEDGRATDFLTGHYERILGENLAAYNDVTSGEIYSAVIERERGNTYGGVTVQVVPHVTDEIKKRINSVCNGDKDVIIIEVGGTVGDIEAQPFMEALRQLKVDFGKSNVAYVHVSLVPFIDVSGEQKTKPTQHSVKELQNLGIQPDVIVCRSQYSMNKETRDKLAQFCNVDKDCVVESLFTNSIYDIPLRLEDDGLCKVLIRRLKMEDREPDLASWRGLCERIERVALSDKKVRIGLVSRLASNYEAHISVREALFFAGLYQDTGVEIVEIAEYKEDILKNLDGIVITQELHDCELKIKTAKFAQKRDVPILLLGDACVYGIGGLDYDLVIKQAKSCKASRCGALKTKVISSDSILHKVYGGEAVERHINHIDLKAEQLDKGLIPSGLSADGHIHAYESKNHRFYAGVMFLPQFSTTAEKPNKLMVEFIKSMHN